MLDAAELKGDETVYDLGAGDGRLLILAKRRHPGVKAIGYEVVPLIWLFGSLRAMLSRTGAKMRFGNALKADIRDADCIFLYLLTGVLPAFERKFDRELKAGTKVISNTFPFPGREPLRKLMVPGFLGRKMKLYVYEW